MKKKVIDRSCLHAAYQLYAEAGSVGLTADHLRLKTGWSHASVANCCFDQKQLREHLFRKHYYHIIHSCQNLQSCSSYIPGLFHLLSLEPVAIRFHRQLLLDQKEEDSIRIYRKLNAWLNRATFPLWAAHVRFTGDPEEGKALHLTLINLWLLYLDPQDISPTSLINNTQYINSRLRWFQEGVMDFDNGF